MTSWQEPKKGSSKSWQMKGDGAAVGSEVGAAEGMALGDAEGSVVGDAEGAGVGDGEPQVPSDTDEVGAIVGDSVKVIVFSIATQLSVTALALALTSTATAKRALTPEDAMVVLSDPSSSDSSSSV